MLPDRRTAAAHSQLARFAADNLWAVFALALVCWAVFDSVLWAILV